MTEIVHSGKKFSELGLSENLIQILNKASFIHPTPIQEKTIPISMKGVDVLGIAQTGTGKTLAFGLPLVDKLQKNSDHALILVPTRELALQVFETLKKTCATLPFYPVLLIGGESMGKQLQFLRKNPRIIVATPGRLNDHLEQRTVKLNQTKILVIDEADRMLDMGFAPQIKKIVSQMPTERQTMLFSATMPKELMSLVNTYMKNPQRIEVAPQGTTANLITQEIFVVNKDKKASLLLEVLKKYPGRVLVFMRTKHTAKKLTALLRTKGIEAAEIHSNRSLQQRIVALEGFKKGRFKVLVATDIAARGIHVTAIELVVNYDLPEQLSDYVHRIGRTGRAGHIGHAISFATPDQKQDVMRIERLIGKKINLTKTPEVESLQLPRSEDFKPRNEFGRRFPRSKFGRSGPRNKFKSPRNRH